MTNAAKAPPFDDDEEWRPVKGYENRYLVSSQGRVYSIARSKILSQEKMKTGRLRVGLSSDNTKRHFLVHRLVASAFDCPGAGPIVNHIDGDPANNCASNLEWCTYSQNMEHAIYTLESVTPMAGSKHHQAKLTEEQIPQIRQMIDSRKNTIRDIAKIFGVGESTIHRIKNKTGWVHV